MVQADTHHRYHVVCRECRTEKVFESAAAAESFTRRHAEATEHIVVYEPIE
ncbi:hypothetical protein [Halorubrum vacuolatum]|uniref:Uncharacterized protein n=1 Tax=Halorubrum vacuolatum TaxID=63740 RepID=A0A238V7C7_HALVU|nr:hypothetical protein [Halorubrum vacuolatum]SNR30004.1 hypothetical protein SAMN06264855_10212 [Halorubrum vacuolatum]